MKRTFTILLMALAAKYANCLEYEDFMQQVISANKSYMAEKYNIQITEANIEAAGTINNPEVSFNYGNNQDWNLGMGQTYEVGLSYSIPLGGVRKSRIRLAKGEFQVATAELEDYLSSLRMTAAEAFADAWMAKHERELAQENYDIMSRIALSDSARLANGDINKADAMQSSLEARTAYGKLIMAYAEYRNALLSLSVFIGGAEIDTIGELPSGIFALHLSNLEQLKITALECRKDLLADSLKKQASQYNINLVKAELVPELTLNAGYVHSNEVVNELAPAPKFDGFTVGFSIPLPFAAANKGAMKSARFELMKSDCQYQATTERVYTEVEQAYNRYKAAEAAMSEYDTKLLNDAHVILDTREKGYYEGEWSLAELLMARTTYIEIMRGYYEAAVERFIASATLNRMIGK